MSIFGKKKQTIDLLPEKEGQKKSSNHVPIYLILVLIVAVQVTATIVLFVFNSSTQSQLTDLQKDESEASFAWQKYSSVANDIKQIKAKLLIYNKDSVNYLGLDERLDKLRTLVPDGVSIDSITINNKGKTSLTGHASKPEDAYQMVNVVTATKGVTNVSLNTVTKKGSDYTFDISFNVNK